MRRYPASSEPAPAATGPRNDWQTIRSLLPYLSAYKRIGRDSQRIRHISPKLRILKRNRSLGRAAAPAAAGRADSPRAD
ncbi:hypothetical protein BOC37_19570 [Burkholderia pseudomallei]|nr:hypothetical protein BOC37_19570 [Burkholderia pseudomallei]